MFDAEGALRFSNEQVAPVHLEGHPRIGQREARPRENGREDPCEDDVSELRSWPGKGILGWPSNRTFIYDIGIPNCADSIFPAGEPQQR